MAQLVNRNKNLSKEVENDQIKTEEQTINTSMEVQAEEQSLVNDIIEEESNTNSKTQEEQSANIGIVELNTVSGRIVTEQELEIEQLKEQLEERDKQISNLNSNFASLQEQINLLMKMNNNAPSVNNDELILVGCRQIYGGALSTNDGRYVYSFGCDEIKEIGAEELKILFRESIRDNKRLFSEDCFYFVDPSNYKKFGIRKDVDLSRENIIRILTLDKIAMIDEVNKMTNHLINFTVTHSLQFEIVKLLIDRTNPLKEWKYENRVTLENYIGQKFDDLMASVGALELLGRKKFS